MTPTDLGAARQHPTETRATEHSRDYDGQILRFHDTSLARIDMNSLITTPADRPEDRVRAAAGRYDDERGTLTASALAALARRQATAGKTCAPCGAHRPFSAFGQDATRDDTEPHCRSCRVRA